MNMNEDYEVTAKTVSDISVSRFRDPNKSDLIVLTFRTADGDFPFAMDRRVVNRLISGLGQVSKKLTTPRNEN
jgi:hypothetical protein